MLRLLSANKIRLKKSRMFWIGLLVTVGYCLFLLIMNYIEKVSYIGNSIVQLNYYLLSPFSVISFVCPIFSSIFIGTEYSDGTMRNRLIVGHTRKKIYLANFITVAAVNVSIALIASMVTALLGTMLFGWNIGEPLRFLLYYISGMMMLIAFAGLFTFIAMAIHNKTTATVTAIITFLISYLAEVEIRRLVFAFYNGEAISDMFPGLSNDRVSQPVIEFLYDFIPTGQCLQITGGAVFSPVKLPVYSALFTALTILCGVLLFSRKDIK